MHDGPERLSVTDTSPLNRVEARCGQYTLQLRKSVQTKSHKTDQSNLLQVLINYNNKDNFDQRTKLKLFYTFVTIIKRFYFKLIN